VEYPSYGLYKGKPNTEQMKKDSEIVFDYFINLGYPMDNIIVMGRSIGTGIATHLASVRKPGMLVLVSAYTCLQDVIEYKVGTWAKGLLAERFRNIDCIERVECPVLFMHGDKDKLIPHGHSVELSKRVKGVGVVRLLEGVGHKDIDVEMLLVPAMRDFMKEVGFCVEEEGLKEEVVGIPMKDLQWPGDENAGSGRIMGFFKKIGKLF